MIDIYYAEFPLHFLSVFFEFDAFLSHGEFGSRNAEWLQLENHREFRLLKNNIRRKRMISRWF